MKKYFYGIKEIELKFHGDWSDAELIYKNKSYNYYDLEDALIENYKEYLKEENLKDDKYKFFSEFVKNNEYLAFEYLENLEDVGAFYEK